MTSLGIAALSGFQLKLDTSKFTFSYPSIAHTRKSFFYVHFNLCKGTDCSSKMQTFWLVSQKWNGLDTYDSSTTTLDLG